MACRDAPAPPWNRLVRLGVYEHPLRGVIRDIKFTAWRRLGQDAGRLLAEGIRAAIAADVEEGRLDVGMLCNGVGVVPMPDSRWRVFSRGIDHALTIARGVCSSEPLTSDVRWRLVRPLWREARPSQVEVRASDRASNAALSFHSKRWGGLGRPLPRTWVVLDDVMTTGATMRACTRALRGRLRREGVGRKDAVVMAAVLAIAKDVEPVGLDA